MVVCPLGSSGFHGKQWCYYDCLGGGVGGGKSFFFCGHDERTTRLPVTRFFQNRSASWIVDPSTLSCLDHVFETTTSYVGQTLRDHRIGRLTGLLVVVVGEVEVMTWWADLEEGCGEMRGMEG